MTKKIVYRYLGLNGVIETPVQLEDVYFTRVAVLTADPGKTMTNGEIQCSTVRVPESEVSLWTEIDE